MDAGLSGATPPTVPVPVEQLQAQSEPTVLSQESGVVVADQRDLEAGVKIVKRKRKTTQNDQSHGSFFLRIGAIGKPSFHNPQNHEIYIQICLAFGLGTMIYNGLEFGTFFEVPISSPCYMILRGINPVLQMIFTFMQMYFIFMNSRVNHEKPFKTLITLFNPCYFTVKHPSLQSNRPIWSDARGGDQYLRLGPYCGPRIPQGSHLVPQTLKQLNRWLPRCHSGPYRAQCSNHSGVSHGSA